jgi:hypothetical protein
MLPTRFLVRHLLEENSHIELEKLYLVDFGIGGRNVYGVHIVGY